MSNQLGLLQTRGFELRLQGLCRPERGNAYTENDAPHSRHDMHPCLALTLVHLQQHQSEASRRPLHTVCPPPESCRSRDDVR